MNKNELLWMKLLKSSFYHESYGGVLMIRSYELHEIDLKEFEYWVNNIWDKEYSRYFTLGYDCKHIPELYKIVKDLFSLNYQKDLDTFLP